MPPTSSNAAALCAEFMFRIQPAPSGPLRTCPARRRTRAEAHDQTHVSPNTLFRHVPAMLIKPAPMLARADLRSVSTSNPRKVFSHPPRNRGTAIYVRTQLESLCIRATVTATTRSLMDEGRSRNIQILRTCPI